MGETPCAEEDCVMKPKAQLPTWRREVLKLRTKMENWTSTFPRQQSKLILLTVRLFYQQFPISWDTGFFFSFKTINYFHSILNFQTYFVFIELKWKMWFACTLKPSPCWFLVKPNVPLLNATIFHVDSNLNFFLHVFQQQQEAEKLSVCPLFPNMRNIVLWAGKKCTASPSAQLSSLWTIFMMIYSRTSSGNVDNLKQNPSIAPGNKQTRDMQVLLTSKMRGRTSLEHNNYFICGLQHGNKSTQGQHTSKWKRM